MSPRCWMLGEGRISDMMPRTGHCCASQSQPKRYPGLKHVALHSAQTCCYKPFNCGILDAPFPRLILVLSQMLGLGGQCRSRGCIVGSCCAEDFECIQANITSWKPEGI